MKSGTQSRWVEAGCIAAGLIFLISGFAKAFDAALFARVIYSYGFSRFQFLAPVIIVAEVVLGTFLFFRIRLRWTSAVGAVMVAVFTMLYTYALLFKGIKNCGCFGRLAALNTSPVFLYIRNAVLLALLVFLWLTKEDTTPKATWFYALIVGMAGISAFMAGNTYKEQKSPKASRSIAVQDSPLKGLVETFPDSTGFVFVFSYSCPHCMNSIANVESYRQHGIADRIMGLSMEDSAGEKFFREYFNPGFPIKKVSPKEIFRITDIFPLSFYIEGDTIRHIISGEVPGPLYMESLLGRRF